MGVSGLAVVAGPLPRVRIAGQSPYQADMARLRAEQLQLVADMRAMQGKGNPGLVNQVLKTKLA